MGKIKLPIDIDPAGLLRDLELQRCERSLAYFIKQAWSQIEPGQPYVHNWHVDMICEHLEAITNGVEIDGKPYNRLLINVPPGTMKSLLLNVFWPAWEWGPRNMPHMRYVCAAHKVENLSARDSRRMRQLITSEWYQSLWGSRVSLAKDQNEKLNFVNSANGFRIATAITSLTGIRGDRVLCFPYDEVVHTEYGKLKIGEMVKSKIKVKVFSSLPGSNVVELKEILNWKENPGSPIVEVGLSDGSTFRCTPDHKVWTSSGWVEAASLNPGHVLPSMTVADRPYGPRADAVFSRQNPLRFFGLANENSVFRSYFRLSRFLTSNIIISFGNIFSKFSPKSSVSYVLNSPMVNSVSFGENVSCFFTLNDYSCNFPVDFGSRTFFSYRKSSVPLGVGNVFRPSSIFKVIKSGIPSVSVFVSDFLSRKRGAFESQHNNLMDKKLSGDPVYVRIKFGISLCWRGFNDFFFNRKGSSPFTGDDAEFAADAAEIADTVKPFKAGDRFPIFVRQIGHAENTFCLEVEDNHTFFVGKGDGVLVSNCDDPHSVDSAISEVQRQAEVSNFLEAIPTRLTNPLTSAIVVIMQRLHEDDVSGAILDIKLGYDHIMLPMRYDKRRAGPTMLGTIDPREEDGELLFPERFPEEVVARDERTMGPYATASQFQQEPVPRGGGIIKDDWWQLWVEAEFPPMDFILASLDTAYTTKQENDYSALTIWGVFTADTKAKITKTMTRYGTIQQMERVYEEGAPSVMLMYAFQERLEFPDLLKKVSNTCKSFKVDKLIIENKAAGISLAQELRRSFSIEDYGIQLVDPKGGDKLARLYSVQHLFSEGMIWAPDKEWSEMVIRQTSSFPKGKHDDLVDSLSQGLRHLREAGLLTRSIERIAEIDRNKVYRGGKPPPLYPA